MKYEDDAPDPDAIPLTGETELPPVGKPAFSAWSSGPQPFAAPPEEDVELEGDIPWELRDDGEPDAGDADEAASPAR